MLSLYGVFSVVCCFCCCCPCCPLILVHPAVYDYMSDIIFAKLSVGRMCDLGQCYLLPLPGAVGHCQFRETHPTWEIRQIRSWAVVPVQPCLLSLSCSLLLLIVTLLRCQPRGMGRDLGLHWQVWASELYPFRPERWPQTLLTFLALLSKTCKCYQRKGAWRAS